MEQRPSALTILVSDSGHIHIVADNDWPLECVQAHHGARVAYRVRPLGRGIRVEGRDGARTCTFDSAPPQSAALALLASPDGPRAGRLIGQERASHMIDFDAAAPALSLALHYNRHNVETDLVDLRADAPPVVRCTA